MDNNNNKRSPLDEIMRITNEARRGPAAPQQRPAQQAAPQQRPAQQAAPQQMPAQQAAPQQRPAQQAAPQQRPVQQAAPQQRPVQQAAPQQRPMQQAAPQQRPMQQAAPQQRPMQQAVTPDNSIDVPNIPASSMSAQTRADKVRMARENALKSRESVNPAHTRVVDLSEMTPQQRQQMEKEREEARRLVQENAKLYADSSATRVSDAVPADNKGKKKKKAKNSEMADAFDETVSKGVLSGAVKAVIYIVSVLVVSGCLALFTILVGNDCFAFVKSDAEVTVNIPEGADLGDIASILKSNDIIKYPNMFKLYITIRGKDTGEYIAGNHTVNSNMGYDTLIAQFKPYSTRNEITVTIIEGTTTQEIIDLFVSKGIGTQEGFEKAIAEYTGDFWFLKELTPEMTKDRTYRLDGYLFPDTYNFFTDATEEDVLYKLLSNFEAKFDIENKARVQELGMTVDDIVILASMIQKEAMYITDYPLVSSVFHNRLNNPSATNGLLQSNATVQYTMPPEEVELELSYEQIEKYDNGYNTFKYKGLPVGPICNSSLNALNWALYPTDTDYYYFVSDMEGFNHYATTWAEHDKNVKTYQG